MLKKIIIFVIIIFILIAGYFIFRLATKEPEMVIVESKKSVDASKTWELIQKWRNENSLKPYEKNDELCKIAETVAYYGYEEREKFKDLYWNYPSKLLLNASFAAESPEQILKDWTNSSENLDNLKKDIKYSCLYCYKTDCVQIYSNLKN